MPRRVTELESAGKAINWRRAFLSGVMGSALMMVFVDVIQMLGMTPFSFEKYLGSLFGTIYGAHVWIIGLFANWLVGGFFGFFYAYCFEYVFLGSSVRVGSLLGAAHAVIATFGAFPFFNALHAQIGTGVYPDFGLLGSGLDPGTPLILFFGHVLYGGLMGLFYGPVRYERVREAAFEPGETVPVDGFDPQAITPEEDAPDRAAM